MRVFKIVYRQECSTPTLCSSLLARNVFCACSAVRYKTLASYALCFASSHRNDTAVSILVMRRILLNMIVCCAHGCLTRSGGETGTPAAWYAMQTRGSICFSRAFSAGKRFHPIPADSVSPFTCELLVLRAHSPYGDVMRITLGESSPSSYL